MSASTAQNRLHVLILKAVLAVCVILGSQAMVLTATVSICYLLATNSTLIKHFSDINECSTGMHSCAEQAACSDNEGNFSCSCNTGFSGDGMTCSGQLESCLMCSTVHSLVFVS